MKARLAVLAAALAVASPALAADTYQFDKSHTTVGFQVRHIVTNVGGKFQDFSGTIQVDRVKPESSSVEFTIQAASIDTNEPKRDEHLKSPDFFDVANQPTITFKSTSVKATGKDAYEVTGNLTMRGVTKPITLPVTFLGEGKDPWGNEKMGFELATTLEPQGLRHQLEQDPRPGRRPGRRRGQGPDLGRGQQGEADRGRALIAPGEGARASAPSLTPRPSGEAPGEVDEAPPPATTGPPGGRATRPRGSPGAPGCGPGTAGAALAGPRRRAARAAPGSQPPEGQNGEGDAEPEERHGVLRLEPRRPTEGGGDRPAEEERQRAEDAEAEEARVRGGPAQRPAEGARVRRRRRRARTSRPSGSSTSTAGPLAGRASAPQAPAPGSRRARTAARRAGA